jgi:hypothetical protein
MPEHPFVPGRTTGDRQLARQIAEEVAFALQNAHLKARQTNVPATQRVEGEVSLKGMERLEDLLDRAVEAIYDTEAEPREVQKVEVTNPAEFPAFPEIPPVPDSFKVSELPPEAMKLLERITEGIGKIGAEAPKVEVQAPAVTVQAPGNESLEALLAEVLEAVRSQPRPVQPKYGPVLEKLEAIRESVLGLTFPSPERLPRKGSAVAVRSDEPDTDFLYETAGGYAYLGEAPPGTPTSAPSWSITRVAPGSVPAAVTGAWDDRATLFS